jgi:hypothetical protein
MSFGKVTFGKAWLQSAIDIRAELPHTGVPCVHDKSVIVQG